GKVVARERYDLAARNPGERGAATHAIVGFQRLAGDAGAKPLRAPIASERSERILGRAYDDVSDRLAGYGVPAADHPVAAAGEKSAPVRKKGGRPDRQSRSDEGSLHLAREPIDNGDRTTHAGGGDAAAGARRRHRDDRR